MIKNELNADHKKRRGGIPVDICSDTTEVNLSKFYKEAFEKIKEECAKDNSQLKGIQIIDEDPTNGYYAYGDNSVVNFRVKGCKNWLFGCWFSYDPKKISYPITAEIFCQHERYLDKFKPARGTYRINTSINIFNNTIESIDYGFIYELNKICEFIHKYPYLAYEKDVKWVCDYNYERQKLIKCFFEYYIDGIRDWWGNTIHNYLDNKVFKFIKEYATKKFSEYNWEILEEEGCSPKYTLKVELPDNDEQATGVYGLFDNDEDEIAWNDLNVHCNKISDICRVYWYSNISDCIIFWNKKKWEEYQKEINS